MKVLITGTSSGIGKGIADKFLREGHHVTGIDCNKSAIQHTAYRHICMDIRDKMHYPELGPFNIVINNCLLYTSLYIFLYSACTVIANLYLPNVLLITVGVSGIIYIIFNLFFIPYKREKLFVNGIFGALAVMFIGIWLGISCLLYTSRRKNGSIVSIVYNTPCAKCNADLNI